MANHPRGELRLMISALLQGAFEIYEGAELVSRLAIRAWNIGPEGGLNLEAFLSLSHAYILAQNGANVKRREKKKGLFLIDVSCCEQRTCDGLAGGFRVEVETSCVASPHIDRS